ncbi:MAG: hypothetical protein Q4C70_14835 [Planctomycetia bacterium]|nr:hypothetical protein [Planctomycetia bacterium]
MDFEPMKLVKTRENGGAQKENPTVDASSDEALLYSSAEMILALTDDDQLYKFLAAVEFLKDNKQKFHSGDTAKDVYKQADKYAKEHERVKTWKRKREFIRETYDLNEIRAQARKVLGIN